MKILLKSHFCGEGIAYRATRIGERQLFNLYKIPIEVYHG